MRESYKKTVCDFLDDLLDTRTHRFGFVDKSLWSANLLEIEVCLRNEDEVFFTKADGSLTTLATFNKNPNLYTEVDRCALTRLAEKYACFSIAHLQQAVDANALELKCKAAHAIEQRYRGNYYSAQVVESKLG